MAIMTRLPLSGSTNGKSISITSAEPGQTIHTVSTATAVKDTLYLFAQNIATDTTRELTLNWGGTGSRDAMYFNILSRDGLYGIVPGLTLIGATDIVVRGYGTSTGSLLIYGYVDRAS